MATLEPGKVHDFTFAGGLLHGIVETVADGTVTLKSTTNEHRLTVPEADVQGESGAEWFALHEQVAAEREEANHG